MVFTYPLWMVANLSIVNEFLGSVNDFKFAHWWFYVAFHILFSQTGLYDVADVIVGGQNTGRNGLSGGEVKRNFWYFFFGSSILLPKAYSESCQTSKMEPFAKIVNG